MARYPQKAIILHTFGVQVVLRILKPKILLRNLSCCGNMDLNLTAFRVNCRVPEVPDLLQGPGSCPDPFP